MTSWFRALWLATLLVGAAGMALVPTRAERLGTAVCFARAPQEATAVTARGRLRGPVMRAGVRQRAVVVVDQPVEDWGRGAVTVRTHATFAGSTFQVAGPERDAWLCPLVEAPPPPSLLAGPRPRPGAAVGDRTRVSAGPCVRWPPADDPVVLDTTAGVLVQTHGLDTLLGDTLADGLVPWVIEGSAPDAPPGAFVEVVSRYLQDAPLASNTALAPVSDGRFRVQWRAYPWAEPLLCRWVADGHRVVSHGCAPVVASAEAREKESVAAQAPFDSWGPLAEPVGTLAPSRLPASARLRLDLAARCEGPR